MNIEIFLKLFSYGIFPSLLLWNMFSDKQLNMSMGLITGAFAMLSTEVELLMHYFNPNLAAPSEPSIGAYVFAGFLLIVGVGLNIYEKKQHQVFNLLGENNKKELIDSNYKVQGIKTGVIRERSIDFMSLANLSDMNDEINKKMVNIIKDEAININNFPQKENLYLTSMASIPHSVLFGSYLDEKKNARYINYNRFDSEFVLLPEKPKLIMKVKSGRLNIEEHLAEIEKTGIQEVLVSISGTFTIHEEDIDDFQIKNRVSISTSRTTENNMTTQSEVKDVAKEIMDYLMDLSKTYSVIHITAAIPGMLSVELGKMIRNRGNQVSKVIVYHYNSQTKPKYKFGVIINGDNKNELIERGI